MIYRKNITRWEQWARVLLGLLMAVLGPLLSPTLLLGAPIAIGGLVFAATGLLGWCPACAMVGRRLKDQA